MRYLTSFAILKFIANSGRTPGQMEGASLNRIVGRQSK